MTVRIGNGAGFWGDYPDAPRRLLERGEIDYLQLEYLAEVTMGVLHRLRERDPEAGYVTDFLEFFAEDALSLAVERDVRVVTNAGGLNTEGCAERLREIVDRQGLDLTVATVTGDDLTARVPELADRIGLEHMDTGESVDRIADDVVVAAAYLGAFPIARALDRGADVVVTGRVADPALALGPLVHEFGWGPMDWDRLAAGTVAGHLIECSAQVTGGNSLADWRRIDYHDVGSPIVAVEDDGTMTVTKPADSGGEVSVETVSQQLVYEIGDPAAYVTPDVTADFTGIEVEPVGEDAVRVRGCRGEPAPEEYKVSVHYENGYALSGTMLYSRPDALAKAQTAADVLERRIEALDLDVAETNAEYVGYDAAHGQAAPDRRPYNEIMLRFAAWGPDEAALRRLGMEFAPLSLSGPPAVTGLTRTGRPRPRTVIDTWPTLVPASVLDPEVSIDA